MVNSFFRIALVPGLLFLSACASQGMAQTVGAKLADVGTRSCDDGNSAALAACMEARQALAAVRMEQALADVLQRQPANVASALQTEQRAWTQYYDASCRYWLDRDAYGREGQLVHYPACRMGLLNARTQQLETMLNRTG